MIGTTRKYTVLKLFDISVIVPVYNVENYLDECLDSLERQTDSNIEIICVNDGSTDGSRAILDARARRLKNMRIIDKPNGGLSSARNAGIRAAQSEYVCFLDSDDLLAPFACEIMKKKLDETGADVLVFGAELYPNDDENHPWLKETLSPRDFSYDAFSPDILFAEKSHPFAWRIACRTALLDDDGITFDESLRYGEDEAFLFGLYPRAHKVVLTSKKLYEYRYDRSGSLMSQRKEDLGKKLLDHISIVHSVLDDWSSLKLADVDESHGKSDETFLNRYIKEAVWWIADFVLFDALRLEDCMWRRIADEAAALLEGYVSKEEIIASSTSKKAELDLLSLALSANERTTRRKRLLLWCRFYCAKHGRRQFINMALHKLL